MSYNVWHSYGHTLAGPEHYSPPDGAGSGPPPPTPGFSKVVSTSRSDIEFLGTIEDKHAFVTATPCSGFLSSSFQSLDKTPANSSPTLLSFLVDSPESSSVTTPKLEEPESSCLDSSSSSLVLSPYAPMPLPPIFTHECGSKVAPFPMDNTSASFWTVDPEIHDEPFSQAKCESIDPTLDSSNQSMVRKDHHQFVRGSVVFERLWPPIHLKPPYTSNTVHLSHFTCPRDYEWPRDIPLGVAKRQAAEFRATGTDVSLSSLFLMQFLGQPMGQTKWHCYIQGCGKQLIRKGHMMDHVRMHLDERSFACEKCSQKFLRKADCKRHVATHDTTKGFQCEFCPKSYARKDLLTRHTRVCRPRSADGSEVPSGNRNRLKKKKGILTGGMNDSQGAQAKFVSPEMLFLQHGGHKVNEGFQLWGYDEGNKENIDPSLVPSGPMFNCFEWKAAVRSSDGDPESRRKKARIRL